MLMTTFSQIQKIPFPDKNPDKSNGKIARFKSIILESGMQACSKNLQSDARATEVLKCKSPEHHFSNNGSERILKIQLVEGVVFSMVNSATC